MFTLLVTINVLIFGINHASATSCNDLQKSQLISLNERMTQMIDTISSLLPKPIKKLEVSTTPTPASSVDFIPSSPAYQTPYYAPLPTYPAQPPIPLIMYAPPSNIMVPPPIPAPQTTSTPRPYYEYKTETGLQPDYGPKIWAPRPNYQYEHFLPYQNVIPMTMPYPPPPLQPAIPHSPNQQLLADYRYTPFSGYPLTVPVQPSIPSYFPGQHYFPVPVYPRYLEEKSPQKV